MKEKSALVTGISRGIGYAIAKRLLDEGYSIHGTYNTGKKEAETLAFEHPNLLVYQADFNDRDQIKSLLAKLKDIEFDAIVNNAGVIEFESFNDFDFTIWDKTFQINLHAPLQLILGLIGQLRNGASIVNISSLDGMVGSFASMAYSASKAALINLTMSLANNFGIRNIRVNALAPGWIDTGMSTPESMEATKITPLGRNGNPDEVAALTFFLLSNEASFITGETIVIDGGYGKVDYIMLQEAKDLQKKNDS